jgi:hypothetical protein
VIKKTGVRGFVAAAVVCVVTAAMPVAAGAATNPKCSSDQIDVGGTCTSKAEVSKQILSITRGVMAKDDAKGVVVRVDFGNETVVNKGLGISRSVRR